MTSSQPLTSVNEMEKEPLREFYCACNTKYGLVGKTITMSSMLSPTMLVSAGIKKKKKKMMEKGWTLISYS